MPEISACIAKLETWPQTAPAEIFDFIIFGGIYTKKNLKWVEWKYSKKVLRYVILDKGLLEKSNITKVNY